MRSPRGSLTSPAGAKYAFRLSSSPTGRASIWLLRQIDALWLWAQSWVWDALEYTYLFPTTAHTATDPAGSCCMQFSCRSGRQKCGLLGRVHVPISPTQPIHQCSNTAIKQYINQPMQQYSNTAIQQYSNTAIQQYSNTSIKQHINQAIHQFINQSVNHLFSQSFTHAEPYTSLSV